MGSNLETQPSPSETREKQAAFSQVPGRCQKESGAPGTMWLPECNTAVNPHACTLSAPPRWVRHWHVCGSFPEAAQCAGIREGAPTPQKLCWDL